VKVEGARESDEFYMARALALAERGRGSASPNPLVGAVIVDADGVIVGRGAHLRAGEAHAEIHAIADAGDRARGATLYCTLEPCSHTGRTGPCAPRVIEAGILRAVVATADPNPQVAGRGLQLLAAAGLDVRVGVMAAEAEALNRAFFTVMRRRRPFVTMKVALSADGRVAASPGARTPMTGHSSARLVHRERAEVDAVAVGSGTILADDPLLTARVAFRQRPLARVVFDTRLRTPPGARMFSTLDAGPVIIVTTPSGLEARPERAAALEAAGARLESIEAGESSARLAIALERLATSGVTSLVVEGGPGLHRAFWDAGLVDRVEMYITPRLLGPEGVEWLPFSLLAGATLSDVTARLVGDDILIEAYVYRSD
jgi:diaminohydroxyphosphoribosylaminopyrimidine deaminase / 5-amino-6-(5-phosphoribosylamino)uracil reductase